MLKDYLKEKNISIYSLSKELSIPYTTLSDLANAKIDIKNCRYGILKKLAAYLGLTLEELEAVSYESIEVEIEKYRITARVLIRGRKYHAQFIFNDEPYETEICDINCDTRNFCRDVVEWRVEDFIDDLLFRKHEEELWNTLS